MVMPVSVLVKQYMNLRRRQPQIPSPAQEVPRNACPAPPSWRSASSWPLQMRTPRSSKDAGSDCREDGGDGIAHGRRGEDQSEPLVELKHRLVQAAGQRSRRLSEGSAGGNPPDSPCRWPTASIVRVAGPDIRQARSGCGPRDWRRDSSPRSSRPAGIRRAVSRRARR